MAGSFAIRQSKTRVTIGFCPIRQSFVSGGWERPPLFLPCNSVERVTLSSSRNALSFSSARTTNLFPSSRCASAIQIVRPSESFAEIQPELQPDALCLSAMSSQYFTLIRFCGFLPSSPGTWFRLENYGRTFRSWHLGQFPMLHRMNTARHRRGDLCIRDGLVSTTRRHR